MQVVNALADAGADLGWKDPANGWTALHAAVMRAQNSQVGAVQSLAARGGQVEVDAQDNNGWTPLHKAAYNGNSAAAQALLEAGADASIKNGAGMHQTAPALAASKGRHKTAACIWQADEMRRRLCGARQRLALAMAMLATIAGATAGLGDLPYDVLRRTGEAAAALEPPAVRVALRATHQHARVVQQHV